MDKILSFDKPKKVRSTQNHNDMFQSDSGVAGTYVQNMSKEDKLKWKAKHIKGSDERVEIRKTFGGTQLLIVVYKNRNEVPYNHSNMKEWHKRHKDIVISMNGKADLTYDDFYDIREAVNEATEILL